MSQVISQTKLGECWANALGLDPATVRRISIDIGASYEPVVIDVELMNGEALMLGAPPEFLNTPYGILVDQIAKLQARIDALESK